MYSKIKIAGRPVHPMLVAFPVACYAGTLVGFAVYAANGHLFWLNLAIARSVAGTGTAVLAALAGLADWALGIPRDSAAKMTGLLHAELNVTALGLFLAAMASYVTDWNGCCTITPSEPAGIGMARRYRKSWPWERQHGHAAVAELTRGLCGRAECTAHDHA